MSHTLRERLHAAGRWALLFAAVLGCGVVGLGAWVAAQELAWALEVER